MSAQRWPVDERGGCGTVEGAVGYVEGAAREWREGEGAGCGGVATDGRCCAGTGRDWLSRAAKLASCARHACICSRSVAFSARRSAMTAASECILSAKRTRRVDCSLDRERETGAADCEARDAGYCRVVIGAVLLRSWKNFISPSALLW